jgi:hypothetical protein
MSMKSYANSAWEIPASVLEKNFPDQYKFIMENESEFSDWLQDTEVEEELSNRFTTITEEFVSWCESKGLEVGFDYRSADEENDNMNLWMIWCENAITINPVFKELGGTQVLWTTFG